MFSVMDVSLEKNTKTTHLWVVALDPTHDDKTVTNGAPGAERQMTSNSGETFGRFSPDGKFVSYTGSPTKDDPVSRITIATWDEKTGTIGMGRTLKAVSGDADGAIWSPDSKHFLFTTDVYPECSDKTTWAEEDACDKANDDAAVASPVKAQVWDTLLYRHWELHREEAEPHYRSGFFVGWGEPAGFDSGERGGQCGDADVFCGRSAELHVGSGLEGDCVCNESG